MAKRNKKEIVVEGTAEEITAKLEAIGEAQNEKQLLIVQGSLPDEHCNYSVQINTGPTKGMVHNVKGKPNIVHSDLSAAFQKFKPHLAALCDLVDSASAESFEEIDNHASVDLCHVTGFKIKGAGEAESISLIGSYHSMTAEGRIDCSTPYMSLEGHDNYRWYNELKEAADLVRQEIELYNDGKCTPQEEEKTDRKQLSITDQIEEEEIAE